MVNIVERNNIFKNRQKLVVPGYTETISNESYYITPYLGGLPANVVPENQSNYDIIIKPQAYYVEQPPNSKVPAHYHDTNQFQVFFDGEIIFGKKLIDSLAVHYANGHTPYGPLVTTNKYSHYLTLRNKWDSGGKTMPDSRKTLKKIKRKFYLFDNLGINTKNNVNCHNTIKKTIFVDDKDGLNISLFSLGPHSEYIIKSSDISYGAYVVILNGELFCLNTKLNSKSCIYLEPSLDDIKFNTENLHSLFLILKFPNEV
ncbi:hypothetical protein OAK17_09030 [Alphaproteobacteria bacterium]|nr:hypothetical protein [Alphaproteobacteria bacterium]